MPKKVLFDPARRRSDGLLTPDQINYCKAHGIELAFDPVQQGVVPLHCEDDITPDYNLDRPHNLYHVGARPPDGYGQRNRQVRALIIFRPWQESDVATFVSLLDNPKVWQYLPEQRPNPLTADLARDLIHISNEGDHHLVRAIEIEGQVVGQVRLLFSPTSDSRSEAEVSYWIGEDHWGRGIASTALSKFTQSRLQKHKELTSIWARVHRDNRASIRVLESSRYRFDCQAPDDPAWHIYRIARTNFH